MHDQANGLRKLVQQNVVKSDDKHCARASLLRPRLIITAGGKGGVGTTTVAVNLTVALAQQGSRTLLIDADCQGGDAALMCRVEQRHSLIDVINGERNIHEAIGSGPGGVQILPGAWASTGVEDFSEQDVDKLLDILLGLHAHFEFVVVDVGNGLGKAARRLWKSADLALVVTNTELTSVMDSYASIKVFNERQWHTSVQVLVNMAPDGDVAEDVHRRLARACHRFLSLELHSAGHIVNDPGVAMMVTLGEPFVVAAPLSTPARQMRRVAETVVVAIAKKAENLADMDTTKWQSAERESSVGRAVAT